MDDLGHCHLERVGIDIRVEDPAIVVHSRRLKVRTLLDENGY